MRAQHRSVAKDRQQFLPHEQVLRGPDASVDRHKVSALLCANPEPHASAGQLLDLPNVGRKVFRHSHAFQHLHWPPRACSGYETIQTHMLVCATKFVPASHKAFQVLVKYRIQSCDLPRTTRPAAGTMPSLSPVNLSSPRAVYGFGRAQLAGGSTRYSASTGLFRRDGGTRR